QPFSPVVVYTSSPKDTTGATAVHVQVDAVLDGAELKLELLPATDLGTLNDTPWRTIENGAHVEGGDATQYRITLTSDGWRFPSVSRVELDYYQ
ncbi:MAG TPA: hypothetical protein VGC41_28785, partial [Kofleriaceae bacterium]